MFTADVGHRNSKTPRQLRNPIIHQLAAADIEEASARCSELLAQMQRWLDLFRNQTLPEEHP